MVPQGSKKPEYGSNHGSIDACLRGFQPPENMYTLRPFHIASIESAGIVPPSS